MSNRLRASRIHLIVGVASILFSVGLITPLAPLANLDFDKSGINLGQQIFFLLVFVFIGGYEIGKYVGISGELRKSKPPILPNEDILK